MNTLVITTCFTARVTRLLTLTLLLMFITAALSLLSACGGDDPAPVIPNANLTGYYSVSGGGSATVNTSTTLTDLQILVSGNRMMIMSASAVVLYEATVTVTGNNYTANANVVVYENGFYTQKNITLSGSINPGVSISGTFSGGTGLATGSFSNVMRVTDQANAALTQVTGDWTGDANGNQLIAQSVDDFQLTLESDGTVPDTGFQIVNTMTNAMFFGCTFSNAAPVLTPVAGTALYTVSMTLTACQNTSAPGTHTGLATVRNGTLVMMFVNVTNQHFITTPSTDPFNDIFPASGIVELTQP